MSGSKRKEVSMQESLKIVETVVKAADERMTKDIMVLDVANMTPVADYFIIMDASNERQLSAIVENISEKCHLADIGIKSIEGKDGGKWILMDLYDVVVHVFYYSERAHYHLEKIWLDAPTVDITSWLN